MTISVIIGAYNAEDTIAETLASVLGQTLLADEIIVVDDGSTDRTAQVAAAASESIRIVRQDNKGAAAALNAGINRAKGDLLSFIDADDLWEQDKLVMQARILAEQPELDGVAGHLRTFLCPTNDEETNKRYRIPDGPEPCWLLGAMLLRRHCLTGPAPFPENLMAGYHIDWFDRARAAGLVFGMIPDVVLHRSKWPGAQSSGGAAAMSFSHDVQPSDLLAAWPDQPVAESGVSFRYRHRS
jgi:glycosyltransferase involved in cell wall biosynthesis